MKELVLFGTAELAQVAYYYFTHDSDYEVVAFTVDAGYIKEDKFCDLPVVPFENLISQYPPDIYELFIALAYSKVNAFRKGKYLHAKALGYKLASYISTRATVLNQYQIGDNCFILEDNTIQPFSTIGNNVTLWSGNHIGHHSVIEDHAFISSHVVISGGVKIGEQCFIGVNAALRDHISVGDRCIIGAGALLLSDAEPDGLYIGAETKRSELPASKLKRI